MNYCITNKLLEIDLSRERTGVREIPDEVYRNYFAGSGLGAKLFRDEIGQNHDPDAVYIMAGLLTGTIIPTACKASICHRSFLTGIWNESTFGGHWPQALKQAGFDGIIIKGIASRPVYLWITKTGVQIKDASSLWGKDTLETQELIRKEVGEKALVGSIGPAGENGVLYASVMFEGSKARAAGRGGTGALWGMKNLKAIAIEKTTGSPLPVFNKSQLKKILKTEIPLIKDNVSGLAQFGTAGGVETIEALGDLPIKNWQLGRWPEGARKTSSRNFLLGKSVQHDHCFACPIGCGKIISAKGGSASGGNGQKGPEYETTAGFGAMCLNDDPEIIIQANLLCTHLGLDTISTSSAIAFAMEAYEKGIINQKDTDGMDLKWGNREAILGLIEKIARRQGLGEVLSLGVKKASEILGKDSALFAVHTKGMEVPYHDPRAIVSMAINYATANRGACHLEALSYVAARGLTLPDLGYPPWPDFHSADGQAKVCFDMQNYMSVYNPLGLCKFLLFAKVGPDQVARWLRLATGWTDIKDGKDLLKIGERIFNLKRNINLKLGITKKDDCLPPRLLTHPRPDGLAKGVLPKLDQMLKEYYQLRGWNRE